MAMSESRGAIAKHAFSPAARRPCVRAMNRSNPSTVAGGGERYRVTSSVVSASRSAGASVTRSSRSVTIVPVKVGRPVRQSFDCVGSDAASGIVETTAASAFGR